MSLILVNLFCCNVAGTTIIHEYLLICNREVEVVLCAAFPYCTLLLNLHTHYPHIILLEVQFGAVLIFNFDLQLIIVIFKQVFQCSTYFNDDTPQCKYFRSVHGSINCLQ